MKAISLLTPVLLALSSCSTPPTPPSVDVTQRRPANSAEAVALQTCQGNLHNAALQATERDHDVELTKSALLSLTRRAEQLSRARTDDARSTVYTVLFPFGSTRIDLPMEPSARLVREARTAPLVLLSGRTDGTSESAAESRIARERSEAVRAYLIAAGVSPSRIRATWQPIGDHAAENTSVGGRSLNRRVEIEVYRLAPRPAMPETTDPN